MVNYKYLIMVFSPVSNFWDFLFLWRFVIAFSSINSIGKKTWLMLAAWKCSSFFIHFLLSWLDLVEVSFQEKCFSSLKNHHANDWSVLYQILAEIFFVHSLYKYFSSMKKFWLRTCNYWLKLLLFNYKTDFDEYLL